MEDHNNLSIRSVKSGCSFNRRQVRILMRSGTYHARFYNAAGMSAGSVKYKPQCKPRSVWHSVNRDRRPSLHDFWFSAPRPTHIKGFYWVSLTVHSSPWTGSKARQDIFTRYACW